ncbi:MAG: hypothetical protein AB7U98_01160 [Candidatus Nitrosocosmicus sp.]
METKRTKDLKLFKVELNLIIMRKSNLATFEIFMIFSLIVIIPHYDTVIGQTERSFNVVDDTVRMLPDHHSEYYKFQTDPLAENIQASGSYKVINGSEIFINIYEDPEDISGNFLSCPAHGEGFIDFTWCKPVYTQQATAGGIDAKLLPGKTYYLEFQNIEGGSIEVMIKLDIRYTI